MEFGDANNVAMVYACVRLLSESVASLPVRLLRITPQGRVQEIVDPLYHLLAVAPNPETTSFVYWETVAFHLSIDWQFLFRDRTVTGWQTCCFVAVESSPHSRPSYA